jgi:hypothetical protein
VRKQWDITTAQGHAKIEKEITRQAAMFGYTADFTLLALGAVLGLPMLLMMGGGKRNSQDQKDGATPTLMVAE